MKTAYDFFHAHAGYSYDPATETPEQGRARCAQELADAEAAAREGGLSFAWDVDTDADSRDFKPKTERYDLWACTAYDENGNVCGSLGGVDFGADGSPYADSYRRVVEAELALGFMTDDKKA